MTYDTAMISSTADIGALFRADQTAAELDGRIDTISMRSGQFAE